VTSKSVESPAFHSQVLYSVGALIGSLVLYVASSGPVAYYLVLQSNHSQGKREEFLTSAYTPLAMVAHSLDLDEDYWDYCTVWIELAWKRHPECVPDEMGMSYSRL
jgi:hypothetical protein